MGVFTTTKSYRLGLNLTNQWWLSGASIDLDFDNQRYYDSSLGAGVQSLAPLNSYLSISRASTGYAKTAAGALTSFGNDTLRITDLGLLVEDARTNVVLRSQELNDAAWQQDNLTGVTADATTAPDGTTTADKIIPNTSNTFHRLTPASQFACTSGVNCTWSVYAKPAGYNFLFLTGNSGDGAYFNLSAGTVGTIVGTITSSAIEALANGWYRCSIVDTTGGATDRIFLGVAQADGVQNSAGDGSSGIYAWGAQFENNVSFPSSYIPTAGASATRAQDAITCVGGLNTLLAGSVAYSVVMDLTEPYGNIAQGNYLGSPADPDVVLAGNANNQVLSFLNGSALTKNFGSALLTTGVKIGSGINIPSPARSLTGDGQAVASDANVSSMTSGQIYLGGRGSAGANLFGVIRRATFWNSKLADATLQGFTA